MKNIIIKIYAIIASIFFVAGVAYAFGGTNVSIGGSSGNNPQINSSVSVVTSCLTGSAASSTIASVKNPLSATSTLLSLSIVGTEGATTSDILIATSSTPSPAIGLNATSTLAANILNLAAIGSNSQFYSVAGVKIGPSTGYKNPSGIPGSVTQSQVVVGPKDYVVAFSTSTAVAVSGNNGATGASQVAVPSSCTVKSTWSI